MSGADVSADDASADDFVDDIDENDINRVRGAQPRAVLDYLARSIVDDPDAVEIEVSEDRSGVNLRLHVAPEDMGKVIGRRGRVAQAVRTVVRAAAAREGIDARVDIVD
ncbi:MAG: KH domain-containing protein [Acidimicrobiales bacterium]